MINMDNIDFRNYAFDRYNYDTGTLSGLEKYLEWLEKLIVDQKELDKVKKELYIENSVEKTYIDLFLNYVDSHSITVNNSEVNAFKCFEIAKDLAIMFAYWITDSKNNNVKGSITIEDVFEIYLKKGDNSF